MKETQKKRGLQSFLAPFLETGDEIIIAAAKKEYWRQYKMNWRKQKRKEQKTFEISFTKGEWQVIKKLSNKHAYSHTNFIKQAALAYCKQEFLMPDILAYNRVREALYVIYTKLINLEEDCTLPVAVQKELLQSFLEMEQAVKKQLTQPQTIEEKIVELIKEHPDYKLRIIELLQTCSL